MDESQALDALAFLPNATEAFRNTFFETAIHKTMPAGSFICLENNQCGYLPLVLRGEARVYKMSDEGRELTLYPILTGDSCILTASCIMNDIVFPANAIAVTDIEALLVPSQYVRRWLTAHPDWSSYIFSLLSRRLVDVISLVEEVAFQRMDVRLARYLSDASANNTVIKKTHEAIATDLGTSREVVSRLLKELEYKSVVSLSRGAITVLQKDALTHRSA
ncbi:MAG: Crp/Fnr family transcriptional regulator [Bacteroidota bacterium]